MVKFIYENGESRMVSQKPITIDLARKIHRHKKEVENCVKDMHSMHKVRKEINEGYFSFLSRPIPYEVNMDVVASQAEILENNHARLLDQIENLSDCKNDPNEDKCPNYEADNDEEFAIFLIPSQLIRDILKDINKDESEKNEEETSEPANIEVW